MIIKVDENLIKLAEALPVPLYIVGGYVRNYLIDKTVSSDIDIAAALSVGDFCDLISETGFHSVAKYKRTNTVVIKKGNLKCEFASLRTESYEKGGKHLPLNVVLTNDVCLDALRRDFKCNAVYYDIKKDEFVDPLGGLNDIKNKVLDTVTEPEKVFMSDGLRLMRLARFAAELGFEPTKVVLTGAKEFSKNIIDISPERIFTELKAILVADNKHSFSPPDGHYRGMKILEETGVLDHIIPELTLGRGMAQRADFHKYDVLEHSLRCVLYSDKSVRLSALLHDVGKPFCMKTYGKYHGHADEGARIAQSILNRLKADSKTKSEVIFNVKYHMKDLSLEERENKIRKFIVDNYKSIEGLLLLKQADYRASMDYEDLSPTVIKWRNIISEMEKDGTPFSVKDMKISSKVLTEIGFIGEELGAEIKSLFNRCVLEPSFNDEKRLMVAAERDFAKKRQ